MRVERRRELHHRRCNDPASRGRGGIDQHPGLDVVARTATRTVIAAGACAVQDVRDRDGVTRPMLRRLALHLAVSKRPLLQSIGTTYLRGDPPAADELRTGIKPPPTQLRLPTV
jgi:hypothetical protein